MVRHNSALVFKTQRLRISLHKEAARQESFCSSSSSRLVSLFQGTCPAPRREELPRLLATSSGLVKIEEDGSHQTCQEDRLPAVHSRFTCIPTCQWPFLWSQEGPLPSSPNSEFGEDSERNWGGVLSPEKWLDDCVREGGMLGCPADGLRGGTEGAKVKASDS